MLPCLFAEQRGLCVAASNGAMKWKRRQLHQMVPLKARNGAIKKAVENNTMLPSNGRGCNSMSCSLLLCSQSSSYSFGGCFALSMRPNLFDSSLRISPPNFANHFLCAESLLCLLCTNTHLGWKVPPYADHGLRGRG